MAPLEDIALIDRLVEAARTGDAEAFGRLYDAYAVRVYRFCAFRVGRPADAEDLTQTTFVHIVEGLPKYQARGLPFGAWVFSIARHVVIDFKRARRDVVDLAAVGDILSGADDVSALCADRDALWRAIAALTDDQRDVIAYRYFADLSARDIGRLMHRNEATVRGLHARALGALRRRLDATAPTPEPDDRTDDHRLEAPVSTPLGQLVRSTATVRP